MPQTTKERADRWPGADEEAILFLVDSCFNNVRGFWFHKEDKALSEREADAIIYLMEEWDYGGYCEMSDLKEIRGWV